MVVIINGIRCESFSELHQFACNYILDERICELHEGWEREIKGLRDGSIVGTLISELMNDHMVDLCNVLWKNGSEYERNRFFRICLRKIDDINDALNDLHPTMW